MAPGAGARSAADNRLSDARERWSRVSLWASELQPEKVGGCTVAPHDRCLNTNKREITIVVRGQGEEEEGALVVGLGRGDALRCS